MQRAVGSVGDGGGFGIAAATTSRVSCSYLCKLSRPSISFQLFKQGIQSTLSGSLVICGEIDWCDTTPGGRSRK